MNWRPGLRSVAGCFILPMLVRIGRIIGNSGAGLLGLIEDDLDVRVSRKPFRCTGSDGPNFGMEAVK